MVMRIICVESTSPGRSGRQRGHLASVLCSPTQDPQHLWGHMEGVWEDEGAGGTEADAILPFHFHRFPAKSMCPCF